MSDEQLAIWYADRARQAMIGTCIDARYLADRGITRGDYLHRLNNVMALRTYRMIKAALLRSGPRSASWIAEALGEPRVIALLKETSDLGLVVLMPVSLDIQLTDEGRDWEREVPAAASDFDDAPTDRHWTTIVGFVLGEPRGPSRST